MLLTKKIQGSGIAEVVIALTIIAMCFTIASLVFIRATSSPMKFMDVKQQTEIQSEIMQRMLENDSILYTGDTEFTMESDPLTDSLVILIFQGSDGRVLWQQQKMAKQ